MKLTNPEKEDYIFVDWYKAEALTQLFIFDQMSAENITLYAKWDLVLYTIMFDSNGEWM